MSKDIKIEYIWTEELAIKSSRLLYEDELKHSNKKYIGWFFIALAQFGVVGALKHNAYGMLFIASVGLLYWYAVRWSLRKFFIKNTFKKSPFANKTIKILATKTAIVIDGNELPYQNIKETKQIPDGLIINYIGNAIFIPNSGFSSADDRALFKTYLKNNK